MSLIKNLLRTLRMDLFLFLPLSVITAKSNISLDTIPLTFYMTYFRGFFYNFYFRKDILTAKNLQFKYI